MTATDPNPFVYILPAILLIAVVFYYIYGIANRFALETHQTESRVTGKQIAPGSTTYNTNIVDGRAWVQSTKNPDFYIVQLEIEGQAVGGSVTPQMYESLQPGERVRVEFKRTRFSNQILVTDVRRQ